MHVEGRPPFASLLALVVLCSCAAASGPLPLTFSFSFESHDTSSANIYAGAVAWDGVTASYSLTMHSSADPSTAAFIRFHDVCLCAPPPSLPLSPSWPVERRVVAGKGS